LLTALPQNDREIQDALDRGQVQVLVRVLPGFGRDILLGRQAAAQILVDGTNSQQRIARFGLHHATGSPLCRQRSHPATAVAHDGPRRHGNHESQSAAPHRQPAGVVQSRSEEPQLLRSRRDQ